MNRGLLKITVLGILLCTLIIAGCHKRAPEPPPPPPLPEATPIPPTPTPTPEPTQSPEEIHMMKLNEAKTAISATDIYFDFDKAILSEEATAILAQKGEYLVRNPDIHLIIEGHCDERGSNEYNIGLSQRRASAAKKYLVAYGVNESNIDTVPYGEERPVCHESNETCWSKNRRDHFVVK